MTTTYRNPWHKLGHYDGGPEFYETDAEPVRIGKYLRYHRIKSHKKGSGCYDYVYNGVCFAQTAGPLTEAEIDENPHAQGNLLRFCNVSFGAILVL